MQQLNYHVISQNKNDVKSESLTEFWNKYLLDVHFICKFLKRISVIIWDHLDRCPLDVLNIIMQNAIKFFFLFQ